MVRVTATTAAMISAAAAFVVLAGIAAGGAWQSLRSRGSWSKPAGGDWPQHRATIVDDATVHARGRRWRVEVRYRYVVAGDTYEGDTIRATCGPDGQLSRRSNTFGDRSSAERFAAAHIAGTVTEIHVNPIEPAESVLTCRPAPHRVALFDRLPDRAVHAAAQASVVVLGAALGTLAAIGINGG